MQGYLDALGMARTAEVKRDARIGEAEAQKDSQIKEAIAEEERMAAKYINDTEIAKAQRDFELKKATYDMEVQAKVGCSQVFIYFFFQVADALQFKEGIGCKVGAMLWANFSYQIAFMIYWCVEKNDDTWHLLDGIDTMNEDNG